MCSIILFVRDEYGLRGGVWQSCRGSKGPLGLMRFNFTSSEQHMQQEVSAWISADYTVTRVSIRGEGFMHQAPLCLFPVDPVDTESTKMDSSFSVAGLAGSPKKRIRVECRCGSDSCRKYLFWQRPAGNAPPASGTGWTQLYRLYFFFIVMI